MHPHSWQRQGQNLNQVDWLLQVLLLVRSSGSLQRAVDQTLCATAASAIDLWGDLRLALHLFQLIRKQEPPGGAVHRCGVLTSHARAGRAHHRFQQGRCGREQARLWSHLLANGGG